MTLLTLVGVIALVSSAAGQQPSYVDYDYQDISTGRQVGPPARSSYTRAIAPSPRFSAQSVQPRPTPVPILKQINRHNDDGSYTYGYEGADGSFKIETKLPTGEVMGKYGYVDDTGKLRVIEYGANKYGFQPAGEGITVAPPTLVDETTARESPRGREGAFADYDDGTVYTVPTRPQRPQKRPELFAQRREPTPSRSYTGFEQEIRATPSYEETPISFVTTPAPRFSTGRRPSPVRYSPQVQQQVPQIPHQEIPQQFQQAVAHIPQASPVPPRAVIPGSVPVGQVFTPAPTPPQRPAPVREFSDPSSGSLLDQLLKQYALPAGVGQPLHDISFGSYSSQTNY